jgi:hypothetical protein
MFSYTLYRILEYVVGLEIFVHLIVASHMPGLQPECDRVTFMFKYILHVRNAFEGSVHFII